MDAAGMPDVAPRADGPAGARVRGDGTAETSLARRAGWVGPVSARRAGWVGPALVRGVALFVGLFLVAGLVGTLRHPGSYESVWLFDAGNTFGSRLVGPVLLALAGLVLVAHGVRPSAAGWRRALTAAAFAALALVAVANAVTFYRVWAAGEIAPRVPVPLSLVLAAVMTWGAFVAAREVASPGDAARGPAASAARPTSASPPPRRARFRTPLLVLVTLAGCIFVFPLAQIVFFGTTDYRRPADVAVVFGAQVHPGGAPSQTLAWRVDTACELYEQGLVRRLVMSGAVGESGYDEAQVMRARAIADGVPAAAIVVDSQGVDTEATVRDTVRLFRQAGVDRVLAVSNAYHLPRIKLAYRRQGQEVFTVPAEETRRIKETPYLWLREVPAFWVYYVRGLVG